MSFQDTLETRAPRFLSRTATIVCSRRTVRKPQPWSEEWDQSKIWRSCTVGVLGFDVDPINSVQFSNHTGYGTIKGQVLNADDLEALYAGLKANDINHYSHLLTGYIGSKSFLLAVKDVILDLKKTNPKLIYVCDPVMGDQGVLYVPEDLLPVYKEHIVPHADIITPNQFETELLTGIKVTDVESAKQAIQCLHKMGAKTVVISSSELGTNKTVLMCFASSAKNGKAELLRVDIPTLKAEFTGTGDLFAALLLAWSYRHPTDFKLAIEKVISTMQLVLKETLTWTEEFSKEGKPLTMAQKELRLIQCKSHIENPKICVKAVQL